MPSYSYSCLNCKTSFELFYSFRDYTEKPKCPSCHKKTTEREYIKDLKTLNASVKKSDSELKTIGDLAQRNSERLSDDEKQHLYDKHNAYKEHKEEKPLPSGMTRMKKGNKTIWPK
ncbi:MAG: zinc ribbon domain-containing protein [Sphingobacteriia bacterium]|nr:zinc ribbon domain-containing protein [Sphingobacteriia bacterium]